MVGYVINVELVMSEFQLQSPQICSDNIFWPKTILPVPVTESKVQKKILIEGIIGDCAFKFILHSSSLPILWSTNI